MVIDTARFETTGYRDHSSARRDNLNAKFKYDLGSAGVFALVLNALDQPETEDPLGLTSAGPETLCFFKNIPLEL